MKHLFINISLSLLASCALFSETPPQVLEAQRASYQGINIAISNNNIIIDTYIKDNMAAVTYHVNYVFEPLIQKIRVDESLTKEEKSAQIAMLEGQRDNQLEDAYKKIREKAEDMRKEAFQNLDAIKNLIEAAYEYFSTAPLKLGNLDFWVNKLKELKN